MSTEPVIGERIPLSLKDASDKLSELGDGKGEVARLEAEMNEETRAIQSAYAVQIDPVVSNNARLTGELVNFADNDLAPYLEPGKKSLVLRGGTIGHALSPESVEIADEKKALDWLRKKRWLEPFTTRIYKRVIAKRSLLENPDMALKIPGVTIGQSNDVILKPHQLPGSMVVKGKRVRIKGERKTT